MYHLKHDVALGWVHLVERLPRDDDHRGHRHQSRRDPEGQGVAGCVTEALHVLSEDRRHDGADEGAGVDAEVEHGEEGLKLALLLRKLELVTTKGGDTGLDATSAKRDKSESEKCHRPETKKINSKYEQVGRNFSHVIYLDAFSGIPQLHIIIGRSVFHKIVLSIN